MIPRRILAFLMVWPLFGLVGPRDRHAAPKLVSVFPLGGQRGTALEVEARGSGLEGTYAVWLGAGSAASPLESSSPSPGKLPSVKNPEGIEAHVKAVPDGSRAKLQLVIAPNARLGFQQLGVVSPAGVSGTVPFWVGDHAVAAESGAPHRTPDTARAVSLPVAITGRISESGQLNYYTFEMASEQTVTFAVISTYGTGFDPQLALYETRGSFLDPARSKRLLFREELTQGSMPASRRMTYHFTRGGRYLISLSNLFAQGRGDFSYLLRITAEPWADGDDALTWARRRLQSLRARALEAPAVEAGLLREAEPNDLPEQGQVFTVPAVIEGTVRRPGDIDRFRFHAKAGQKLAFELQTPRASPPHFNPRLDVLDAQGAVVLTSLQVRDRKIVTETVKVIQTASQVTGKLDREGDYCLRIRDLTTLHGSPDHIYRVLVRPEIPHIDALSARPDGPVNLRPGAKQRLMITTSALEGYAGSLALSVEGLPQGVRAFVGASSTVVELAADVSAPLTPMPRMLRISGLPVVGEKSGSAFQVAEIPIMVVRQ